MASVRLLDLSNRGLTSAQFSDLPLPPVETIEDLDLSHNKLTWLPDGVGGFTSLRRLSFYDNEIVFVHDALWRLTRLETLNLANNRIDFLGDGVEALTSLRELDLRGNPIHLSEALRRLRARGCAVLIDGRSSQRMWNG
jgi:Leucine-rich repeat (LRR) protein